MTVGLPPKHGSPTPVAGGDPGAADRARTGAAWITGSTLLTSAANYAFSLLLIRLLAPADYVGFAAAQSLLLILGSGAMAAIPWALAQHVAVDGSRTVARHTLTFGLFAATVQGLGFAAAAYVVLAPSTGHPLALSAAAAAFASSVITAPLGLLQGRQQIARIAVLRVIETVVRLGLATALLLGVRADPSFAVAGFTAGSLVLLGLALIAVRDAFPLSWSITAVARTLLVRSARLGAVQVALASLGAVDTIVVTYSALTGPDAAAYQVGALLGRVPLYLGAALALSYFPGIVRADDDDRAAQTLASGTRLLLVLGVPVAALVASCPVPVLELVADDLAPQVAVVLPATSLCGLAVAAATVVMTGLQARDRFRQAVRAVMPIAVAQPLVLAAVGRIGDVRAYAAGAAVVALVALAIAVHASRGWRPWSAIDGRDVLWLAVTVVTAATATLLGGWTWFVVVGAALGCANRARAVTDG